MQPAGVIILLALDQHLIAVPPRTPHISMLTLQIGSNFYSLSVTLPPPPSTSVCCSQTQYLCPWHQQFLVSDMCSF